MGKNNGVALFMSFKEKKYLRHLNSHKNTKYFKKKFFLLKSH